MFLQRLSQAQCVYDLAAQKSYFVHPDLNERIAARHHNLEILYAVNLRSLIFLVLLARKQEYRPLSPFVTLEPLERSPLRSLADHSLHLNADLDNESLQGRFYQRLRN